MRVHHHSAVVMLLRAVVDQDSAQQASFEEQVRIEHFDEAWLKGAVSALKQVKT